MQHRELGYQEGFRRAWRERMVEEHGGVARLIVGFNGGLIEAGYVPRDASLSLSFSL